MEEEEEKKEEETNTRTTMTDDQKEKLRMAIEKIQDQCRVDSPHKDIRTVAKALELGRAKLQGEIISGGYTNYSYKIILKNDDNDDDVTILFAKVAFSHALWSSQDTPFDLHRQRFEFNVMKEFSKEESIVTPYFLMQVSSFSILVTEWAAPADEQWGNQFMEGAVDRKVLSKAAEILATVNLSHFDPSWNKDLKDDFQKMVGSGGPFEDKMEEYFDEAEPKDDDDFAMYLQQEVGREKFDAMNKARIESEQRSECLLHGDAHVFNCLVEAKPDIKNLDMFGKEGSFILCDWELARPGRKGHDIGLMMSFPIMCSYFHAIRGHTEKAIDIIDCMKELWDHYERFLDEKGNANETYITDAFQGAVSKCGSFTLLAFYVFGCFTEYIDKQGLSQMQINKVMGRVGITALKFMELGFGMDDTSTDVPPPLDELRHTFYDITTQNIQILSEVAKTHRRNLSRRSSLLRASGKRVSDASIRMETIRRFSSNSMDGNE